ncbi:MAG: hypothetical protein K5629_01330 [Eubacteriales bacterium]|nr:hypothetical protein [Eubacteriales bacterium]
MKRNSSIRILAFILCALLTLSTLCSECVFAEGEVPAEQNTAVEGETGNEGDGEGNGPMNPPVTDEPPNNDIIVIPSDANALILMDAGAQSPRGVPGDIVTIVLPMAVNKEYLPSERYMLRNINVIPDIPTDTSVSNWPFDIIDASSARHLQDMSYNSTAEVYFDFRISQFATKGVYPVNFRVNATVWRYDDVNGTTITEDVTFRVGVWVTVVDDGSMSGVTTSFGCLQVAGTNLVGYSSIPVTSPGKKITLKIPVVNVGGDLTNVTITPVVSTNLDEFPFVVTSTNLGKSYSTWASGEIKNIEYTFKVSDYATTGNKAIRFKSTYFENGSAAEASFSTQITVVNGYEKDISAMSVMVLSYRLMVKGVETSGLVAGEEAELVLTVKNNSSSDTAKKVLINLNFANSPGLTLCPGSTDSAYINSIRPGGTATASLKIMAKPDAEAGYTMLGIGLTYENNDSVTGKANQNIMIPISQRMEIKLGTPTVYGSQIKGREGTISLPIINMGRGKALNVRVIAADGLEQPSATYVGDILPGGSTAADIDVVFTKLGSYWGSLIVQYEDANGALYTAVTQVQLNTVEAGSGNENNGNTDQNNQGGSGWSDGILGKWWFWAILAVLFAALLYALIMALSKKKEDETTDNEPDREEEEFDLVELDDQEQE